MDLSDKLNTLVLIDDDNVYLMLCQRTIERSGKFKDILTFNYADEALVYIEKHIDEKIDLIFLDINMPRMNGFEFLAQATEKFNSQFRAKVVIMLTTSTNIDDIEKAKKFPNVKGYMTKPLTDERLKCAVELIQSADCFLEDDLILIDTDQAA